MRGKKTKLKAAINNKIYELIIPIEISGYDLIDLQRHGLQNNQGLETLFWDIWHLRKITKKGKGMVWSFSWWIRLMRNDLRSEGQEVEPVQMKIRNHKGKKSMVKVINRVVSKSRYIVEQDTHWPIMGTHLKKGASIILDSLNLRVDWTSRINKVVCRMTPHDISRQFCNTIPRGRNQGTDDFRSAH